MHARQLPMEPADCAIWRGAGKKHWLSTIWCPLFTAFPSLDLCNKTSLDGHQSAVLSCNRLACKRKQACIQTDTGLRPFIACCSYHMGCGTCYGQTLVIIPLPDRPGILESSWCSADKIAWRVLQVTQVDCSSLCIGRLACDTHTD